jgi:flavin reductase (DIM6/NTAB) family NADH-FMN oxidoreductase RutF
VAVSDSGDWVTLSLSNGSIWGRAFFVHPLVVIGTLEASGAANFAPKHMATPIGFGNWFCFVCTPRHSTFQNILRDQCFTVSYPPPNQVVLTALAASPRNDCFEKPNLSAIPSRAAQVVKGVVVDNCPLYLECELDRMVDGFDAYSLIVGRIVAAQAKPEVLRDTDRDDAEIIEKQPLLAYLSPGRFTTIEHSQGFPFPKGFHK